MASQWLQKLTNKIKKIMQTDLQKKDYVSEMDQFLADFDHKNPERSNSQKKERKKFAQIFRLRDKPHKAPPKSQIWSSF